MRPTASIFALLSLCGNCAVSLAANAAPVGLPLKPDPPFAIDGQLDDWATVPGAIRVDQPGQAVWGAGAWTGPDDLSGTVHLAWRGEQLYLACDVTDDQLRQSERGKSIWKGDHVELYLDVLPELEPDRTILGIGQFQLAFSPGNFLRTGDALTDCPAEAFCYRPEGKLLAGVEIASKRTARGWTIEAAIPWSELGVERPQAGMPLGLEVGLSDTDSPEARQESMLTISPERWAINRARLVPAALAPSDGVAPELTRRLAVSTGVELAQGAKQTVTFEAPAVPDGRDGVLALQARLNTPTVAGHTQALRLTLNGTPLHGDRLLGKPLRVQAKGGKVYSMYAAERLTTYYSPDFASPDQNNVYGLVGNVKACDFALRVTDLLRAGANELVIENAAQPSVQRTLVVGEVALEFRLPPPPERQKRPAPTDEIPTIVPVSTHQTDYTVADHGADGLTITVNGQSFTATSRYSTPAPAWVTGSNDYFTHQRKLEQTPELLLVHDTFTNQTKGDLGLVQRHEVVFERGLAGVRLAGLPQPSGTGKVSEPPNATAYGDDPKVGLGLVAVSDVLRCHSTMYALGDRLGLADENLVLPAGASYTSTWAILPTVVPDYWRLINAARRFMGSNFLIDGAFCFLRQDPRLVGKWSDEQIRDFLVYKDVKYACASIGWPYYKGKIPQGTAFQMLDHAEYLKEFARRRKLVPGLQNLVYFHCFIDVLDEAPEEFADSRLLRPDGKQADYGQPFYKLFYPTETNRYGQAIGQNVDLILNEIKAEGVYWDEHEYSRYQYHYGEPWDNYSGDIDPKSLKVSRRKSCVTLLTEPWRLKLAQRIQADHPLIGNGPPHTSAMAALKFPCFVETGSITNCARSHLYSPIALGDHLTERSELDAYRTMLAALDYGCVYHWYNDMNVIPTHHTLTQYMYPITPLELGPGYLYGNERVVTKVSGFYGWSDASQHEVHVYNAEGVEVPDYAAPTTTRDGRTLTELRLAEDWSAVVVRKR